MMRDNFISGNKNLENPEDAVGKIKIPSSKLEGLRLDTCLSNSFGFGGTNGCIILGKV